MAEASTNLVVWSLYIPLCVPLYDAIVIPITQRTWGAKASRRELIVDFLVASIFVPIMVINNVCQASLGPCVGAIILLVHALEDSVKESIMYQRREGGEAEL